jgi:hypothetical protein
MHLFYHEELVEAFINFVNIILIIINNIYNVNPISSKNVVYAKIYAITISKIPQLALDIHNFHPNCSTR